MTATIEDVIKAHQQNIDGLVDLVGIQQKLLNQQALKIEELEKRYEGHLLLQHRHENDRIDYIEKVLKIDQI